jgi:hypothetical protein
MTETVDCWNERIDFERASGNNIRVDKVVVSYS